MVNRKGTWRAKTKPRQRRGFVMVIYNSILQLNNVLCCRTLGAIDNVKRYPSAFGQRFKTLGLDCGMMYENIFAAVLLNKTKTL